MSNDEPNLETSIALIRQELGFVNRNVQEMKVQMGSSFVTKDEFTPYKQKVDSVIRALVWVVGLLVIGLLGAFFKLVLGP